MNIKGWNHLEGLEERRKGTGKKQRLKRCEIGIPGVFRGDISAASGTFTGSLSIGTSPNWFRTDEDGNSYWGGVTLATALAKIVNTGDAAFQSVTITGAGSTIAGRDIAGFNTVVDDGATPAAPTGGSRSGRSPDRGCSQPPGR